MNKNNHFENGRDEVKEILEKIVALQKRAVREEIREEFCDGDFLGERECKDECNTRPLQLFTHEDRTWHCPIDRDEADCRDEHPSCVFRVEKVEDGTATFRALKEKHGEGNGEWNRKERFESTDSFITIKLFDIAAIRCLKDCFVNICIR